MDIKSLHDDALELLHLEIVRSLLTILIYAVIFWHLADKMTLSLGGGDQIRAKREGILDLNSSY